MAIKIYRPTTPARRDMSVVSGELRNKVKPNKKLLSVIKKSSGRNNCGKITIRHRGGASKRKYRIVDFKRKEDGRSMVLDIQYDPNRSANIALIENDKKVQKYIIAPLGVKAGDFVESGINSDILPGNTLTLDAIPVGTFVHNIELSPGHGGQLARSAGASAQLVAKEGKYAQIKLPSGEVRKIRIMCKATVGQVGNVDHSNVRIGKAGRKRHMGWRPTVRGVVMNPCDHPHGGGEGKSPIGRPGPVTPWGKPTLGYKTRKPRNKTNKFIIKRRKNRAS